MTPQLTVCVPAYNQPEFLRDALESLCDQGLTHDQYIVSVSDDASPTSLAPVIEAFRDRLPIAYHRHPTNVGHIRNYDYGFETARTPLVSFLPHDDVIAPGQLGRAVAIMQHEAACVLVASLVLCQRHPGSVQMLPHGFFPMGAERARFASLYRWQQDEWMALALIGTPMSMVGSIFRADVFRRCREWLKFPMWHDRLMLAEMGLHGAVVSLPWIGGHYRVSAQQLSGRLWRTQNNEIGDASRAILGWCAEAGIAVKEFWIDRICTAEREDRLTFLQLLEGAVPAADYDEIKTASERRLQIRLHTSRLDALGVPRAVAAAIRHVNQLVGRRMG